MTELRECPFCGSADVRLKYYYAGTIETGASIECHECCMESFYQEADRVEELIIAYNRRPMK